MSRIKTVAKVVTVVVAAVTILLFVQVAASALGYPTSGKEGFLSGAVTTILFLPLVGYLFEIIRDAWGGSQD